MGFVLGHLVPLSMARFGGDRPAVLPFAWAISVAGSVAGTVAASILSRELGMVFVILIGAACYGAVALVACAAVTNVAAAAYRAKGSSLVLALAKRSLKAEQRRSARMDSQKSPNKILWIGGIGSLAIIALSWADEWLQLPAVLFSRHAASAKLAKSAPPKPWWSQPSGRSPLW